MRKFIISDIHGFGNVYYSIMSYLDNLSKNDEIELYINGDLIDRGLESAEILLDIKKRIEENKFKIVYLGGNHELLMYNYYNSHFHFLHKYFNDWYLNGGNITDDGLFDLLKDENKILKLVDFIGECPIYHLFDEQISDKRIALVHATSKAIPYMKKNIKIKDNNFLVQYSVWTREESFITSLKNHLGNKNYFTIIGHTPNNNRFGYFYHSMDNYLNIDGGCARYVNGLFYYNHFPLVEVESNYLKILTFNDNNEIIYGNYFDGKKSIPLTIDELNRERSYLNNDVKIKKLSMNEDGIVSYW